MIFACPCDVTDLFAKIPPIESGSACTGRTYVSNRKARIVGHRYQGRFSVARMARDPDLVGIHSFVRLEIIHRPARPPGPCAERTPIVQLAWLPFVHQADDSFCQTISLVGLHSGRNQDGISPALG